MPQVGEQRRAGGETRTWNGSRWEAAPEAPQQEGALSRFFGGAASTSPLNPMNLLRAAAHPIDTIGGMISGPLKNAVQIPGDLKDIVTNERGGGPVMGRVTSAVEALKHLGGSVPLIGPAGVDAGEKIGEGDLAGGAGELAGLASGALLPEVAAKGPSALQKTGGLMERGGQAMKTHGGMSVGGFKVPLSTLGLGEAVLRSDPMGIAVAASPYALEYGGKGLSAAGRALEGLRDNVTAPDLSKNHKLNRVSEEVQGTRWPENPSQMGGLGFNKDYKGPVEAEPSPFEQMSSEGAFGGDRSVRGIGGLETEGPGGLSSVLQGKILPNWSPMELPAELPMDPMARLATRSAERYGRRFRPE